MIKVLLQNFNRKDNKFEFGRQEIFYILLKDLKDFLFKIPYDTSNNTIPIRIITNDLIFEKIDQHNIKYEWNSFYTYRFRKRKKIIKIQELDQLLYNSKKVKYSESIDILLIILYSIVWVLMFMFNILSVRHFMFIENINKNVNIFFLWLMILTIVGFFNYIIKNLLNNIFYFRKKYYLELEYTVINDIQILDITNLLFLLSQYLYIIFIFYYFPNAHLYKWGLAMYISLLIIGGILIFQELIQTYRDWRLNFKKKKNYLRILYTLLNYNKNENSITYLIIASDLKKLTLIDHRLWKILIGLLISLLSLLPIL